MRSSSKSLRDLFGGGQGEPKKRRSAAVFSLVSNGLVARWQFSEGSGTTVADSSGNNFNGAITGTPTWTTGKVGSGLQFDASGGDVVTVTDAAGIRVTNTFSVCAWIQVTGGANSFRIFYSKAFGIGAGNSDPQFMVSDNNKLDWRANHDTTYGVLSSATLTQNQWYHVCGTYDKDAGSGNSKLYLNGSFENSETLAGPAKATALIDLLLGKRSDGNPFVGILDDVRLYNRVLTAQEISTIANLLG